MKYFKKNMENGLTIVESIVAISILSFGILGAYGFFQSASIMTPNFPLNSIASHLSQEGMEVVKNIRDNNIVQGLTWSQGLSGCVSGCQLTYKTGTAAAASSDFLQSYTGNPLILNSSGFYGYDTGTLTTFKRKVTITQPGSSSDILKVDILITWENMGKSFSFNTIGYIYNLHH